MDLPWIKAFMDTRRTEADKIQADWSSVNEWRNPSEAEIRRAALLAWEGHLTSVEFMEILEKSITDIPQDHMERLASVVTSRVSICDKTHNLSSNVTCSILASINCPELCLCMDLAIPETRALVIAMKDRVETLKLGSDVTFLDIEEMTLYDGQGRCSALEVWGNTRDRYGLRLRRWAEDKGWRCRVESDPEVGGDFIIKIRRYSFP